MEKDRKTLEERNRVSEIDRIRHSCAHIMATAILKIWPDAQFAGGPAIENGFYYDFELDVNISSDDFSKIEKEMRSIIKENQVFEKTVVERNKAIELAKSGRLGALSDRSVLSKFKLDLIDDIPESEEISLYKNGDFLDLCAGPHVMRTGNCKAFKLMSIASSYHKGNSKNARLQRIYGTAFKNKTLLEEYLIRLEEAKKRDHRRIGKDRGIFHIDDDVGQGLILWKPNGGIIRNELQKFIVELLDVQGYSHVFTPHIGKLDLYKISGHFPYYSDSQYPPIIHSDTLQEMSERGDSCASLCNCIKSGDIDGYMLKPMNCPHHIKIYQSDHHSYRDLPIRLAEFGTVYRWEQSGELNGMTRVRGFTQDDAHIFCTEDQLEDEIKQCLDLVKIVLGKLELKDYTIRVSLRDSDLDKYVGSDKLWEKAEKALLNSVKTLEVDFNIEKGEAAFYGPKIDFVVKDSIGRDWQLGTVQLDYNLPDRFELSYIGSDNKVHTPIMIHRAPFGSLERFTAILIEHFEGRFPLWLAPEQIRILTISNKFLNFADDVYKKLKENGIRVKLNDSSDKIGAKIRLARLDLIPYMIIIGDKEVKENKISVRKRSKGETSDKSVHESYDLEEFLILIKNEIHKRLL